MATRAPLPLNRRVNASKDDKDRNARTSGRSAGSKDLNNSGEHGEKEKRKQSYISKRSILRDHQIFGGKRNRNQEDHNDNRDLERKEVQGAGVDRVPKVQSPSVPNGVRHDAAPGQQPEGTTNKFLSRAEIVRQYNLDCGHGITFAGGTWHPGGEYTKKLIVRNTSVATQKILYRLPSSRYFSMAYPDLLTLFPGNEVALDIVFRPVKREAYDDSIFITVFHVNNGRTEEFGGFHLPVSAHLASLNLHVPSGIDFGFCPANETSKETVVIRNTGQVDARFEWEVPGAGPFGTPYELVPLAGNVAAGESVEVAVLFHPRSASVFVATTKLAYEEAGKSTKQQSSTAMRISGVGKYAFISALENTVDFGRVIIGELVQEKTFLLRNPSLVPASYEIKQVATTVTNSLTTDKENHFPQPGKIKATVQNSSRKSAFSFSKLSGVIPPGSQTSLTVKLLPTTSGSFVCEYFDVLCPSEGSLRLCCRGSIEGPTVWMSRKDEKDVCRSGSGLFLNFGDVLAVKDSSGGSTSFTASSGAPSPSSSVRVVYLHNKSTIPAYFSFLLEAGGAFIFDRVQGVIPPLLSTPITIKFAPSDPINHYRRAYLLIKDSMPFYVDLLGTGYDRVTRPAPMTRAHVDAARRRAQQGLGHLSPEELEALREREGDENFIDGALRRIKETESGLRMLGEKQIILYSIHNMYSYLPSALASIQKNSSFNPQAMIPPPLNFTAITATETYKELMSRLLTRSGEALAAEAAVCEELFEGCEFFRDVSKTELGETGSKSRKEVTIAERELNFGGVQRNKEMAPRKLVHVSNNTNTKVTCVWNIPLSADEDDIADFAVSPESCDIGPGKTAEFKVFFRPSQDSFYYCQEIDCFIFHKSNRNFRLVNNETLTPPWCLSVRVVGHTFGPTAEHFLPKATLSLSHNCLRFPPCYIGDSVYQTVGIYNKGDTPAQFRFESDKASIFSVYPNGGLLPVRGFCLVMVRFRPQRVGYCSRTIRCILNNAINHAIHIKAEGEGSFPHLALEESIQSNQNSLFFKPTCLGLSSERKFEIKNVSKVPLVFKWEVLPRFQDTIDISPRVGKLKANEKAKVTCRFTPQEERKYSLRVGLTSRAIAPPIGEDLDVSPSQEMKLNIIGQGTTGAVAFEHNFIDAGLVPVNTKKKINLGLINASDCDLVYELSVWKKSRVGDEVLFHTNSDVKFGKTSSTVPSHSKKTISATICPSLVNKFRYFVKCEVKTTKSFTPPSVHTPRGTFNADGSTSTAHTHGRGEEEGFVCNSTSNLHKEDGSKAKASVLPLRANNSKERVNVSLSERGAKQETHKQSQTNLVVTESEGLRAPEGGKETAIIPTATQRENVSQLKRRISSRVTLSEAPFAEKALVDSENDDASCLPPDATTDEDLSLFTEGFTDSSVLCSFCEIVGEAPFPRLEVTNLRSRTASVGRLWEQFSVRDWNRLLNNAPLGERGVEHTVLSSTGAEDKDTEYFGRMSTAHESTRSNGEASKQFGSERALLSHGEEEDNGEKQEEKELRIGESWRVRRPKRFEDRFREWVEFKFTPRPLGTPREVVEIDVHNPGQISADIHIQLPDERDVELERWDHDGESTQEELTRKDILSSNLFSVRPRNLKLPPGEVATLYLHYDYASLKYNGDHALPIALIVDQGPTIGVWLVGRTLAPPSATLLPSVRASAGSSLNSASASVLQYKPQHLKSHLFVPRTERALVPVPVGLARPPIQFVPLYNVGSQGLRYRIVSKDMFIQTNREMEQEVSVEQITFLNEEGTVGANGQTELSMCFRPNVAEEYTLELEIEYEDCEETDELRSHDGSGPSTKLGTSGGDYSKKPQAIVSSTPPEQRTTAEETLNTADEYQTMGVVVRTRRSTSQALSGTSLAEIIKAEPAAQTITRPWGTKPTNRLSLTIRARGVARLSSVGGIRGIPTKPPEVPFLPPVLKPRAEASSVSETAAGDINIVRDHDDVSLPHGAQDDPKSDSTIKTSVELSASTTSLTHSAANKFEPYSGLGQFYTLSHSSVDFGLCPLDCTRSVMVTLSNRFEEMLRVVQEANGVAVEEWSEDMERKGAIEFHWVSDDSDVVSFFPNKGVLHPGESEQVVVRLNARYPTSPLAFSKDFVCKISGRGVAEIENAMTIVPACSRVSVVERSTISQSIRVAKSKKASLKSASELTARHTAQSHENDEQMSLTEESSLEERSALLFLAISAQILDLNDETMGVADTNIESLESSEPEENTQITTGQQPSLQLKCTNKCLRSCNLGGEYLKKMVDTGSTSNLVLDVTQELLTEVFHSFEVFKTLSAFDESKARHPLFHELKAGLQSNKESALKDKQNEKDSVEGQRSMHRRLGMSDVKTQLEAHCHWENRSVNLLRKAENQRLLFDIVENTIANLVREYANGDFNLGL